MSESKLRQGNPMDYMQEPEYCAYLRKDGSYWRCVHPCNSEKDYYYLAPCIEPQLSKCPLLRLQRQQKELPKSTRIPKNFEVEEQETTKQ